MTDYRSLSRNIAALASVRVVGYLLPMITMPYVTRVLGVESWGELALAQVIVGYFGLLTDWGFSISATRKVAALREDRNRLSQVFLSIWAAQWLLAAVSIIVLLLLIAFVPYFRGNARFYFYGLGTIVGGVLFPVWFLTGLERMKQVALIQIFARFMTVPLIFILLQTPADAPLMIAIPAGTGFVAGALTIYWIITKLSMIWMIPTFRQVVGELTEASTLFLSTIWISLYTSVTPAILGMIAGPVAVGYFTLADKVRQFVQSALGPVFQAMFPRMSYLFASNIFEARALLKRSAALIVGTSALASLVLWLFADTIITLLAGDQFSKAASVLRWLAPLPFIISLSNLFGIQIMLPNRFTQAFNRILLAAGTMSLCMIVPFIQWKGAEGASINTFLTESFVTLSMAFYLWRIQFFASPIKDRNP
jgi:PST family polysaccharide transporter